MRRIDLRALALDAYGYASHNVKKCPGTFYEGGCEGRSRPVPGYVYCAKCMRANEANESKAKDEMPRHKFQPMPPNTRGAKSGLCNKCLEHRSHTNHYIDDTKLEKMKDAIKPLDYRLSNTCTHCNGTGRVNGGMRRDCGVCRGTGKLGYSYKVYDAETSCDPRDGKFTSGGSSKSTGNPRQFGSSGRGRVSPEAEKRFAEEMERGRKKPEAKDQVPQDCFDAQILGV